MSAPSATTLANEADQRLFIERLLRILIINYTSFSLKPQGVSYHLRTTAHGFMFPTKGDRNFIPRLFNKDMY